MDSNRKGRIFENAMCRELSVWLVPGDWESVPVIQLPLRRRFVASVPLEGHWNGRGDILHQPNISFPFCVECKNQEGWKLDGKGRERKTWPPWKWWRQCCEQAEDTDGLHPLLLFTRNRSPVYVLMKQGVSECLKLQPGNGPVEILPHPSGGQDLWLTTLDDLVKVPRARVQVQLMKMAT